MPKSTGKPVRSQNGCGFPCVAVDARSHALNATELGISICMRPWVVGQIYRGLCIHTQHQSILHCTNGCSFIQGPKIHVSWASISAFFVCLRVLVYAYACLS
uniref:Uncharacterized protein n=1 Tax=Anguilla anguilla TaxID=7936 RepID=A0A0E9X2U8_ANGAN